MSERLGASVGSLDGAERLQEAAKAIATPIAVEAGQTVVHQGEVGAGLYVVESGALDVVVVAGDELRLPVARLGPGSHFGEMSLLTGTPVSADVVACEPTALYALDAEQFARLIAANQGLLEYLAGELALRLSRTNEQLAAQRRHHAALDRLIAAPRGHPYRADLPSMARATGAAQAPEDDRPVLIVGEEGCGKRSLAQYLHSLNARSRHTVLVVECGGMAAGEAREQLFGDSPPDAVTRFADRLGLLQAADGGTIVLADVDRLPRDVQADLAAFLLTQSRPRASSHVSVRVMATAARSLDDLRAQGGVDDALAEAFAGGHLLSLAPLRKRRRDILPLAEHFLEWAGRRRGVPAKHLGDSARRDLLSYDFGFGNAAELRQVIELAVTLADGDTIASEHLFFGPAAAEAPQIDLLRRPWIERVVLGGRALTAAKVLVALSFAGIAAACLLLPQHPLGRFANMLVWGVWWPALIVSMLLLGRAWCAVCPLSSGAEALQRACGRRRAPPDRLSEFGPVLALLGFVGIVWIEEAANLTHHPFGTALLLIGLAVAAALIGWLYQRHAWCRYLCPLGALGGVFSVVSSLRIRARREVCAASCTGHECYKGTDRSGGCPMFNHALHLTNGQHCKLCMKCLQDCPHQSPRLVLQPPLRDTWRSDLLSPDLVPLAAVVGVLVLLLAATRTGHRGAPVGNLWFGVGCAAIAALGLALAALFAYRRRTDSTRDVSWTARLVYAYTPATAALLLAFHLHALSGLSDVSLSLATPRGAVAGLSMLQLGEGAAAALGGAMTLWALWRVCRLRFPVALLNAAAVWLALGALAVTSVALALAWLA